MITCPCFPPFPPGSIKNIEGPHWSNILMTLFLLGEMVSTCHGIVYFEIDTQNASTTSLICRYGNNTEGQYFDVFRNGRQCLHAAFSTCAEVVNQGCHCEEDMAKNEVQFTIKSPHDYDTLTCKVLNGVSKEKSINVTLEGTKPNVYSSQPQPIAIQTEPSMTTLKETDGKPESGVASTVRTFKALFGLSMLVNVVVISGLVYRNRKRLHELYHKSVCPVCPSKAAERDIRSQRV